MPPQRPAARSALDRLEASMGALAGEFAELLKGVPVRYDGDRSTGGFVIVAPDFHWAKRSAEQKRRQLELLRRYDELIELLGVWLGNASAEIKAELEDADRGVRKWVEFASNWGLKGQWAENERLLREAFSSLSKVAAILRSANGETTIVVPDTNSLLAASDPTHYRQFVTEDAFVFVLLPTVLQELDELKVMHRVPEVREKAQATIRRIKGWRLQKDSSLITGVKVDKTVLVKAVPTEPNMRESLSWLDPESKDDRIIASVLSIQASHPASRVVLATNDINLQNKADAAFVETIDIDP